jgi:hypothetical protein
VVGVGVGVAVGVAIVVTFAVGVMVEIGVWVVDWIGDSIGVGSRVRVGIYMVTQPPRNNRNDALAVASMVLAVTLAAVGSFLMLLLELREGGPS